MLSDCKYICVVCGYRVDALFRQYGPTVLKVTNCGRCGSISDKYIEYDPVIIMLDMVLLSKEAYRHILYNTTFKSYWKLFIILLVMETYLDWSNNNSYNQEVGELFQNVSHNTPNAEFKLPLESSSYTESNNSTNSRIYLTPNLNKDENIVQQHNTESFKNKLPNEDPFLTEKGIYTTFCFVCFDMLVYLLSILLLSLFFESSTKQNKVELKLLLKGLTLGGMGNLFMVPTIIWGTEQDRSIHAPLVLGYIILSSLNIHSVMFEFSKLRSFFILSFAYLIKISIQTYLRTFSIF